MTPTTPSPDSPDPSGVGNNGLTNNPGITPEGTITRRAVKNAQQALQIAQTLDNDGIERDKKSALVESEYNGSAPWDPKKLKAAKQGWRFNISTQFLMSMIDRRVPSLVRAVESTSSLTNSALPDSYPDAAKKTLKFRKRLTKVIRSWPGWREFLNGAALQNVLQGYCAAAWRTIYDWRVEFVKQGDFRVPEGTSLKSEECEVFSWNSWWKPSKLLTNILNPEAEDAGWNVPNCVKAINEAKPKQKANGADSTGKSLIDLADLAREGVAAMNYANGEVGIDCKDMKFLEIDGRATHYIVRKSDGLELFKREDFYPSMGYCVQFISIEEGNNTLYGARGMGRKLYNIARATEKVRCLFLDCVSMSGYQWFQRDPEGIGNKKSQEAQIQVSAPMVLVNMKGVAIDRPAGQSTEAFIQANQMLTMLAENVAGTVLPTQQLTPSADDKTATQAKIEATREEELKASVLERWVLQISDVVSIMQRRLCDPDTTDEIALRFQKELMEEDGLTEAEIIELAKQPAAQSVYNASQVLRGQLAEIAQKWGESGAVDMRSLARLDIEAAVDESIAEEILKGPTQDDDVLMEAARMQMIEFSSMLDGFDVMVSPEDSHEGHLMGAEKLIGQQMAKLTPQTISPQMAQAVARLILHSQGHVEGLKAKKSPKELIAKYAGMLKQGEAALQQVIQTRQQVEQQLSQKAGQLGAVAALEGAGGHPVAPDEPAPVPPEVENLIQQ